MVDEKTANLIFALGLNDPEHHLQAKDIVTKIAQEKMKVGDISGGIGKLSITDIGAIEQKAWLGFVEKIVKKHRGIYGVKNGNIPYPLATETKSVAAKKFKTHFHEDVKKTLGKLKKQKLTPSKIAKK